MNQQDKEWKEEQSRIDEVLKELEKRAVSGNVCGRVEA